MPKIELFIPKSANSRENFPHQAIEFGVHLGRVLVLQGFSAAGTVRDSGSYQVAH